LANKTGLIGVALASVVGLLLLLVFASGLPAKEGRRSLTIVEATPRSISEAQVMVDFPIIVPSLLPAGVSQDPTIFVDSHDDSHSITLIYGDTPAAPSGERGTRLTLQEFEGLALLSQGTDQRTARINGIDVAVGTNRQQVGGIEFVAGWNVGDFAIQAQFEWLDSDRSKVTSDQDAEALRVIASTLNSTP
jgi:hypothetical protein